MKKRILIFAMLFLCCAIRILPQADSWGNLKKVYFYNSFNNDDQVLKHLESIEFGGLKRSDREEIASQLIAFGDFYFEKNNYPLAEAFYKKVLQVSPDYWYVYNKLVKIDQAKGAFFISFRHIFSQLFMMLKSFKASFLLVNQFFNHLFFAGLLVFFLFACVLLIRYFKLAVNDLVMDKDGKVAPKKALIFAAMLLWPVVFLSGWMVYPFLISGLFWVYLNENEKKAVKYMMVAAAAVTVFYGLNLMLERNVQKESFKQVRKVYEGHRFDKKDYQTFDDKLKVAQAFSYYENGDLNTAMDILVSTGEDFKNTQKYDLMGNIYFRFGELAQSINYYRESLLLDDKNEIALNNFALALLKDNDPNVFQSYAQRYPEIDGFRNKNLDIKDIKIRQGDLWGRLFNSSRQNFSFGLFFGNLLGEFFTIPVVYYILIFIVYVVGLPKVVTGRGESSYCSKCSKIIKEGAVHKSYKLCDECHQLFSIKDIIFLEAKILKEKELRKKFSRKYILLLLFSLLIPGLNFNQRENNRLFLVLTAVFYLLLGVAVVGAVNFNHIYLASPLVLNLAGAAAAVLYLIINAFSVLGEENGI